MYLHSPTIIKIWQEIKRAWLFQSPILNQGKNLRPTVSCNTPLDVYHNALSPYSILRSFNNVAVIILQYMQNAV